MQDTRFSRVLKDPRFIRPKSKHSKVTIDKRFKEIFTDDKFLSNAACKIDKFGRTSKSFSSAQPTNGAESLKRFYQLESEDENIENKPTFNSVYGESVFSSSSEDDELCSIDIKESFNCNPSAIDSSSFEIGSSTSRLAIVNLDWDNIQSQDLYQLANSFKPPLGHIKSVKIYYSSFGKERIAQENIYGPPSSIFKPLSSNKKHVSIKDNEGVQCNNEDTEECYQSDQEEQLMDQESDIFYSGSDLEIDDKVNYRDDIDVTTDSVEEHFQEITNSPENRSSKGKFAKPSIEHIDLNDSFINAKTSEDFDEEALRKYQLERLRYCYAIIETDSKVTAEAIYSGCDGQEFEKTCNILDVRYVSNDQIFNDDDLIPNGVSTNVSEKYSPVGFSTLSLMHSKVSFTWDADDKHRIKTTKARFSQDALDEMDFKAYLASSDDEGSHDEDNEKPPEVTRNLISVYKKLSENLIPLSKDPFNIKRPKNLFDEEEPVDLIKKNESSSDIDMEVTFSSRENEKKVSEPTETVFQKQLKKEKEKLKKKKELRKGLHSEHIASSQTQDKSLSLMLDKNNDYDENAHFNLNKILKREKMLLKKSSNRSEKDQKTDLFNIKLDDPRFAEIYSSHSYSIDPSHPSFKNTSATRMLLAVKKAKHLTKD